MTDIHKQILDLMSDERERTFHDIQNRVKMVTPQAVTQLVKSGKLVSWTINTNFRAYRVVA